MAIAGQVAQAIENAKLYDHAQRRVAELEALSRISEAVSESLYLEESLAAIVETTVGAVGATGAAIVLEDGRIVWPEGRAGRHAERLPLRWKGRQIGELVCDRDSPVHGRGADAARLDRTPRSRRARAQPGGHAGRARTGDPPPRQEQPPDGRVDAPPPGALDRTSTPSQALEDSVNRILAIAAVHEVLTERREDDVDLGELVERLRRMIVQGLGAGKDVEAIVEPISLAGDRATALALVFSELLQNALEHGGDSGADRARPAQRRRAARRRQTTARGVGGREARHRPLDRAGARPGRAEGHAPAGGRPRSAGRGGIPGMTRVALERRP